MSFKIDEKFINNFNRQCLASRDILIKRLSEVFDLPEMHYTRSVLHAYYQKYPSLCFDKDIALSVLENEFFNASCFVVDYSKNFRGGYPRNKIVINKDEMIEDEGAFSIMNSNWYAFVNEIEMAYWKDESVMNKYLKLSGFDMFIDRMPKTLKEEFLSRPQVIFVNGISSLVQYKFFDLPEVLGYYRRLMELFYPDFELNKGVGKGVNRYAKRIYDDIFVAIYIDYSFIESQLKNTYMELPSLKVEVFSGELKKNIKESLYIKGQTDYNICRVDLHYFMGSPIHNRIGNSSDHEDFLKRRLFYYFDVYSFYLNKYIEYIIDNLKLLKS